MSYEFCELRPSTILGRPHSPGRTPMSATDGQPKSKAATMSTMPIVETFHTSERISGTPAP